MSPSHDYFCRVALLCACAHLLLSCNNDSPSVSGATNWLRCRQPEDCSRYPEAICSEDGYCLDEAGERIAVDSPSGRVVLTSLLTEEAGERAIMAQWENGTEHVIYLRGCSTTDGLYWDGSSFQRYGAFVQCATEGPAVAIAPGERYSDLVGAAAPPERGDGTWRLVGPYGIGCDSSELLLSAGCSEVVEIESDNDVSW